MTTPGKTGTAPATMETVFIGRQPIVGCQRDALQWTDALNGINA